MNTDKELLASEKQPITAAAVSTDSIIVAGLTGYDRVGGMRAVAQIETSFSGGTGTGMTVEIIQADDAALTVGVQSLVSRTLTEVVAGTRLVDQPLPGFSKPYAGFRFTPTTGPYAAGAVTAGFVLNTETATRRRPEAQNHGF